MKYEDIIFGAVLIDDPLAEEIINQPVFQRLKGIDQAGHPAYWKHFGLNLTTKNYNRFLHSVGAYLLLKRFGAPREEQIAGLLHDISHTAFSHCADYIFASGSGAKQDFQDKRHNVFITQSDIPKIIAKHGFNLERILDEKSIPLQEQALPDLCADRIEYSLRTAAVTGEASVDKIRGLLNKLKVTNNRWVFKDYESAKEFAQLFSQLNDRYYSSLGSAIMFQTVSDYIKHAIDQSYISTEDLNQTDQFVLDKIAKHLKDDSQLNKLLDRVLGSTKCKTDKANGVKIVCKSRAVDPLCEYYGKIIRLSEIEPAWKERYSKELSPKVHFLTFES